MQPVISRTLQPSADQAHADSLAKKAPLIAPKTTSSTASTKKAAASTLSPTQQSNGHVKPFPSNAAPVDKSAAPLDTSSTTHAVAAKNGALHTGNVASTMPLGKEVIARLTSYNYPPKAAPLEAKTVTELHAVYDFFFEESIVPLFPTPQTLTPKDTDHFCIFEIARDLPTTYHTSFARHVTPGKDLEEKALYEMLTFYVASLLQADTYVKIFHEKDRVSGQLADVVSWLSSNCVSKAATRHFVGTVISKQLSELVDAVRETACQDALRAYVTDYIRNRSIRNDCGMVANQLFAFPDADLQHLATLAKNQFAACDLSCFSVDAQPIVQLIVHLHATPPPKDDFFLNTFYNQLFSAIQYIILKRQDKI